MGRPKKYENDEERKAAAAAKKRERRANNITSPKKSPNSKSIKLLNQAAYQRHRRENETEIDRLDRLSKDAESKRRRRVNETENERLTRISSNAKSQKRRLENETENERLARISSNAASQRRRLENETEGERIARISSIAASQRQRRENETKSQRAKRLSDDTAFHRQQRENETIEQRLERLSFNRKIYLKRQIIQNREQQHILRIQARQVTEKEETIAENYCGKMDVECESCGSLNFKDEKPLDGKFTRCCHKGQVILPRQDFPHLLESLMKGTHQHSKNFLDNIRSINSSNAFASMGASISPPPGFGPYVFRIQGQIYHRTGALHPQESTAAKFAQLYILDTAEATNERLRCKENEKCNADLMHLIANMLNDINPFAKSYRMLREVEIEEEQKAEANNTLMPDIVMAIKQDRKQDPRRYNNPRVSEVAVVFQNDDGEPPFNRDLLIHLRPDLTNPSALKTERISILHSNLDALLYPLFFPRGEQGWHDSIPQQGQISDKTDRVTQLMYYSYLFSVRRYFNIFLNGGKLTQQFIVDAYVRIEANRLNFIRQNQKQLKVEDYCVLQDQLLKKSIEKGIPVGKTVILPSSFQGSPRNMHQRYLDAMAIVTKYGRPDLFLTMTCNPRWKEITENLEPWQSVQHRPDLVARVFKLKLKSLLKELKNGLFGTITASVHTIEFQKRGLPHAHILVILNNESKLRTEEDIDNIVWAEIPDKEKYPVLQELVTSHMIHGPCGQVNTKCSCIENGKCTKGFPKEFKEYTIKDLNGYPCYRRRVGKDLIHNGKKNNSWVVPYNPYLLKKYNCHINVEVCASIKSVKYLFKYVYKGHDRANVQIEEKSVNHDEPSKFVDSRYVSAPEAIWRIFAFQIHEQSHTIIRLAVHLPNKQLVYFHEEAEVENIQHKLSKTSTLMEYFALNRRDPTAREYLYREIPEHYVLDKKGVWQPRQRSDWKTIGRMYTISVAQQELYYLRVLLLHVKGAINFESLRTVNGEVHSTFKEAAQALGLLLDDNMWRNTLLEATVLGMPKQLREMFAYICVFGPPTDPNELWNEFKESFLEDFCLQFHKKTGSCTNCESYAMKDVQDIFILHGRSYDEFGLPQPAVYVPRIQEDYDEENELILATKMRESLNEQQRSAYEKIIEAVENNDQMPKCFFIDGPGGSGKTYLYEFLMHHIRGISKVVLPAATTGIAANLLKGGRTMHSIYGISVPIYETSVSQIKPGTIKANLLQNADLLIIDECTMAPKYALGLIDRLLREVMTTNIREKNQVPFGGKTFVLGGDFRQCLPVVPRGTKVNIIDSCLKMSELWKDFTRLELTTNMRSCDPEYSAWLLKLGNGELQNNENLGEDIVEIPTNMLSSDCIVSDIFGNNLVINVNDRACVKKAASHAILCPKNDDVDLLNFRVMERMPSKFYVYKSDDSVDADNEEEREQYPLEFLNSLTPSGMPAHRLLLKVGAIVMLLRNLNTRNGLCNGTRLIVTALHTNVIQAQVITGSAEGDNVLIPRIDLCPSETGLPFKLRRRQFPVKVAFAMTINKSQGQTLQRVGIYLPEPVFGHGQLYVAFSRVKLRSNVKVQVIDGPLQGKLLKDSDKVYTKNIVYKNVL